MSSFDWVNIFGFGFKKRRRFLSFIGWKRCKQLYVFNFHDIFIDWVLFTHFDWLFRPNCIAIFSINKMIGASEPPFDKRILPWKLILFSRYISLFLRHFVLPRKLNTHKCMYMNWHTTIKLQPSIHQLVCTFHMLELVGFCTYGNMSPWLLHL